jgi:uncharacterized membrane protein
MNWFKSGDLLDRAFAVGIIVKGLDDVLEVVGGILLLVVSPTTIDQLSRFLTQHELSEDTHDFLATHLLHAAGSLTGSSLEFGALYLLSHGLIKIVLVTALLRDKIWAYPWMIVFLIVFIVYQIYRMTFAFSIGPSASRSSMSWWSGSRTANTASSGLPGHRVSRSGRRRNSPVNDDLSVEPRRQLLARRLSPDLIDRRARIQERRVPILEPVVGVADLAAHLELDASIDRPQVALLNNGGSLRPGHVLR